ncbi:type II secretion system F family protein [Bilifractor porci]|uniref:Type II secretion protein F n=1 Tax=Bilifractor porci TaxID=2606636 RepID=A0A7X2P7N4_9FIRM|nr:type II secretion system F family protein [Bilifractor porci]MST81646.1 type II secretion protein F [Bilifractor porci]
MTAGAVWSGRTGFSGKKSSGACRSGGHPGKTDYRNYKLSAAQYFRFLLEGALIGAGAVWLCYESVPALSAAAAFSVFYCHCRRRQLATERIRLLNLHFKDFLCSIHTSMAAGYSLENAVRAAAADMQKLYGPKDIISQEAAWMVRQMELQRPVEKLFADLGERSGDEDIRMFGEILLIAKRTGGNMENILNATRRNLCGRIDTREEIETVIASRKLEQNIMSIMPAGVLFYLKISFGDFLDPLYGNAAGAAVMTVCLLLYLAAFVLGRRMIRNAVSRI